VAPRTPGKGPCDEALKEQTAFEAARREGPKDAHVICTINSAPSSSRSRGRIWLRRIADAQNRGAKADRGLERRRSAAKTR
jgi:hypothetical protein